jgi:hypothetical protein
MRKGNKFAMAYPMLQMKGNKISPPQKNTLKAHDRSANHKVAAGTTSDALYNVFDSVYFGTKVGLSCYHHPTHMAHKANLGGLSFLCISLQFTDRSVFTQIMCIACIHTVNIGQKQHSGLSFYLLLDSESLF